MKNSCHFNVSWEFVTNSYVSLKMWLNSGLIDWFAYFIHANSCHIRVRWEFVTNLYVWLICGLIDWFTYFIHAMPRMWHDICHDTNIPWLIHICHNSFTCAMTHFLKRQTRLTALFWNIRNHSLNDFSHAFSSIFCTSLTFCAALFGCVLVHKKTKCPSRQLFFYKKRPSNLGSLLIIVTLFVQLLWMV